MKTQKEIEEKVKAHTKVSMDAYDKGFQKSQEMIREKIEDYFNEKLKGNIVYGFYDMRKELLQKIWGKE